MWSGEKRSPLRVSRSARSSTFFCFGLLGLVTGPIAAEAAPRGLISSTAGIIIGSGEIFGGGIAPAIAGYIAKNHGIQHVLTLALIGLSLGVIVSLFLLETAPRKATTAQGVEPVATSGVQTD
jgi:sugar phosphate permease